MKKSNNNIEEKLAYNGWLNTQKSEDCIEYKSLKVTARKGVQQRRSIGILLFHTLIQI